MQPRQKPQQKTNAAVVGHASYYEDLPESTKEALRYGILKAAQGLGGGDLTPVPKEWAY